MAETKRKYDPVKRREYYLRTRELKGRSRGRGRGRLPNESMLTPEDRANVKRDERLKRQGKTSRELELLDMKRKAIDLKMRETLVDVIQGKILPVDAKPIIEKLRAEDLKVRDDIYKEKNKLLAKRAIKGTPDFVKDAAKDYFELGKRLIDPNNTKPLTFERLNKRLDPGGVEYEKERARIEAEIAQEKKDEAAAAKAARTKKNARNKQ